MSVENPGLKELLMSQRMGHNGERGVGGEGLSFGVEENVSGCLDKTQGTHFARHLDFLNLFGTQVIPSLEPAAILGQGAALPSAVPHVPNIKDSVISSKSK